MREQVCRHALDAFAMVCKDRQRPFGLLIHDPADLRVDARSKIVGEILLLCKAPAEENLLLTGEVYRADRIAHAVLRDHAAGDIRRAHKVVLSAGGDILEKQRLRRASAEQDADLVEELALRDVGIGIVRQHPRVARRLSARDDGELVDGLALRRAVRDDGMADLVVRGGAQILLRNGAALLFRAVKHALYGFIDIRVAYKLPLAADCEDRSFVEDVFKIRTGAARRQLCDLIEIDVLFEMFFPCVYVQDLPAALDVRIVYGDPAVEAAGTQQRRIENVRPVGRSHDDDALAVCEAVHLNKELVERLLPLVVSAAEACAALTADGVDLVDEDDRRCAALRGLEHIADAACADADVELHEFGAGDGEERNVRFACDRLREQSLAGARRSD